MSPVREPQLVDIPFSADGNTELADKFGMHFITHTGASGKDVINAVHSAIEVSEGMVHVGFDVEMYNDHYIAWQFGIANHVFIITEPSFEDSVHLNTYFDTCDRV